jgi:hypothetical protein
VVSSPLLSMTAAMLNSGSAVEIEEDRIAF